MIYELGHVIAVVRRFDKKMTQSELAEKSGVSRNEISAIENLTANPRIATIYKIITALDMRLAIEFIATDERIKIKIREMETKE